MIVILLTASSFAAMWQGHNGSEGVDDGPYLFKAGSKFRAKWIENGSFRQKKIDNENYPVFREKFGLLCDYSDLEGVFSQKPDFEPVYSDVDSIVIISDIHGRFNFYIDILSAHGIIDEDLNWKFGNGRLVVLGDVFDRGDMVTDVLWHLFGLERQAEKAGGRVHLLLGNHEILLFAGVHSYNHPKYATVEDLSFTDYSGLYSELSVIGAWLRTKPVIMNINDILFVHGGISIETVRRDLNIESINRKFHNMVMGLEVSTEAELEERKFLNNELGPVWYRGYFNDAQYCEIKMDSIMGHFAVNHIVVGHTQCEEIASLFGDRVLGIDTSVEDEHPGEILLYKNGVFYRCLYSGERIKI